MPEEVTVADGTDAAVSVGVAVVVVDEVGTVDEVGREIVTGSVVIEEGKLLIVDPT